MSSLTDAASRLEELAASGSPVSLDDCYEFFDALEPVPIEALIGDWEGGLVPTGHPGEGQLDAIRWVGKRFVGRDEVYPIISRGEDGGREINPVMGKATARLVEYRGVVTATMVYDKHPVFDHFRRVSADTVIGMMDRKGEDAPLVFYLRKL